MTEPLPLFPLGSVLFPGAVLPLHVFEERYRTLVHDLLGGPEPRAFGVVAIREGHEVGPEAVRALHHVGCLAVVRRLQRLPDGRFALVAVGGKRFRLLELDRSRPYLRAQVDLLDEPLGDATTLTEATAGTRSAFAAYRTVLGSSDLPSALPADATALSYVVAAALTLDLGERQGLLEVADTAERLRREAGLLARELALLRNLRAVPLRPPPPPRSLN